MIRIIRRNCGEQIIEIRVAIKVKSKIQVEIS